MSAMTASTTKSRTFWLVGESKDSFACQRVFLLLPRGLNSCTAKCMELHDGARLR